MAVEAVAGLGAAATGALLLVRRGDIQESIGRQLALVGLAQAAGAAAALWSNAQEQSSGMSAERKTSEFREELLLGMLFDWAYLTAGVLMIQRGTRRGSKARGIRFVSRGGFQLACGVVHYARTSR
jgi:hypothetical protein